MLEGLYDLNYEGWVSIKIGLCRNYAGVVDVAYCCDDDKC